MAQPWKLPGYTEVKALGSGGFGEVVLARHDASGTQVAIKYLHRQLLDDPEFAALFRAEAAVLASLDDPNVVRLYEYVESPSGAAIVMELIDGVSLREILSRRGQTTPEAALVVLQGSLLGLAAAHARGVVHRDYKPENVLIDGAGASKLTDFGIAARAGDSPIPAGTLAYAPPEQFGGSPATPASDVYAATATFYECLTGRPPFTGDSAERLLYQHLAEPVPLEPVPEPLRPLVSAGLAKDPADRPADGAALVAELRAVAGPVYGPGWEDRGRSALGAAAVLLAALWPSGAPPAVQGITVHRVRLLRRLTQWHGAAVKAAAIAGVAAVGIAVAAAVILAKPTSRPPRPPASAPGAASVSVNGSLDGVAAVSARSAWAVGRGTSGTLILRWNGTSWSRMPSPAPGTGSSLAAVAATSARSAWAVGSYFSGATAKTLIVHWNGVTWTQVPSPTPAGGAVLTSVAATSAGSAWAVGSYGTGGRTQTLVLRWNGTAWTQVLSSGPVRGELLGVAASGSVAWAVGLTSPSSGPGKTLIERWDGRAWIQVTSPNPGGYDSLDSVAIVSADDAWAVGDYGNGLGSMNTLIEEWNGKRWTRVPSPNEGGPLLGVAAASARSAWAVGCSKCDSGLDEAQLLRWNGSTWMQVPGPALGEGRFPYAVAAVSASSAWAVASNGPFKALIMRWNGQMWSGPVGQLPSAVAPASSAVSSPALSPGRQAAQALAALLAQSGTDRAAVTQAFNAVADCSAGLSQDEMIFSNAASSRQALLGKLAALPDRSALSASMLRDLTTAWQASGEADQDFATWTQDEISRGCTTNDQSDASYRAAKVPDGQATQDKKAFAALWTAIAEEYGLPLYRYSQI